MAGVLWRASNLLMVALFVLAVAVQYNDPDPIRWMSIYGMAALACGLAYRDKLHWSIPAATGLVALIWAATIAPRVVGKASLGEMFQSWEMHSELIEEEQEMCGLLIVAFWMAVLLVVTSARSKVKSSNPLPR